MHVISRKKLQEFVARMAIPSDPFDAWYHLVAKNYFPNFAALRKTFNSVDSVKQYFVFNICGNNYRIVAAIHFNRQRIYIREVLTHNAYDHWRAK